MYRLSMRSLSIETPRVLFDISRLVRSYDEPFGTGVDRIDLAIGLDLSNRFGSECHFVHAGHHGVCILPQDLGNAVLQRLHHMWNDSHLLENVDRLTRLRLKYEPHLRSHFLPKDDAIVSSQTTYVVASHSGVGKVRGGMSRLDPLGKMQRLIYIHDLIPIDYPEYQRPETKQQFSGFLKELTDAPVVAVSNSYDTDRRVKKFATENAWQLRATDVVVPTLDFKKTPATPLTPPVSAFLNHKSPYFVIVGTIEPRKNHLLLLQIWRELSQQQENPPRLCIIGKRGWENENVVDMLERCPAIRDTVFEFTGLSDFEVQTMLQNATALLFPSFAEGLGIPILEAAALGVPCVASDIPVFREIAPAGTTFLNPLDGAGWLAAIVSRTGEIPNKQMRDRP